MVTILEPYLKKKIQSILSTDIPDVFLSPYNGQVIERLIGAIQPDKPVEEAPEIQCYETSRGPDFTTAGVDFWTDRDVREVIHSHSSYIFGYRVVWTNLFVHVV
ncbi:MAG: hypothetical protein HRU72_01670 [Planctomycetia bacterium]|nr:hypothetical protein [Candidatus Brocadia sp.]QOJ05354.1 MAG: hypothetical protein HRU72_01670 [Planctomycetia bacterium]TVL94686.1 MAG: hypothetical protein CV082_13875 [Candidatus Brocadia sp. BL1]HQU31271.1 hypothetical protein [Candidatus Brocadia sapporoensis]